MAGSVTGSGTALPTRSVGIPADTHLSSFTHLLWYATSTLQQQSRPAVTSPLVDSSESVSGVTFQDLDLDAAEVGTISWSEPVGTVLTESYGVYLASDAAGALKSQLGSAVQTGLAQTVLPAESSRSWFSHIAVLTRSVFVEQSFPASMALSDLSASVTSLAFQDLDLDIGELGGNLTWNEPVDASLVTGYAAHWMPDPSGSPSSGRLQLQVLTEVASSGDAEIPADTAHGSFLTAGVYSQSVLAEQTTPAEVHISDLAASVSAISFTDLDLDLLEVGGELTWHPAAVSTQVENYKVYLCSLDTGCVGKQFLDGALVGTNVLALPFHTQIANHTHLAVYTPSSLRERALPFSSSSATNQRISWESLSTTWIWTLVRLGVRCFGRLTRARRQYWAFNCT